MLTQHANIIYNLVLMPLQRLNHSVVYFTRICGRTVSDSNKISLNLSERKEPLQKLEYSLVYVTTDICPNQFINE